MSFFTSEEFTNKYGITIPITDNWKIEAACEMIYNQCNQNRRNNTWNTESVPECIKNASMEQLRFMYEYDIPLLDVRGEIRAGEMSSNLKTDYSTLALRILANNGYLFRGTPSSHNKSMLMQWE